MGYSVWHDGLRAHLPFSLYSWRHQAHSNILAVYRLFIWSCWHGSAMVSLSSYKQTGTKGIIYLAFFEGF